MSAYLKIVIGIVLLGFFGYGLFVLDVPAVNADELWIASDVNYLKTHHHPGSSLLPVEVAPIFSAVQYIGWKGWFFGTLRTGTAAVTMTIVPVNDWQAIRLSTFLWSILVCVFTYFLSRRFGFSAWYSLLCVTLLMVIPEFFHQVHLERPEIMICAAYLFGLMLYLKTIKNENLFHKRTWLLIAGLYAWLPSLLIHPSAVVIPVTIASLYLVYEWKNIFSINTFLIGIGLASGCLFFYYITHAMSEYAMQAGGGDFFAHRGPPILRYGWMQLLRMPLLFFNNFNSFNPVAKPVSFLLFVGAAVLLFVAKKKMKLPVVSGWFLFLVIALITPLVVLLLFSGSYGQYNVMSAPIVAIIITGLILRIIESHREKNADLAIAIPVVLLLVCSVADGMGMTTSYRETQEYKRINKEVKELIPGDDAVMGTALYYPPFKNQPYYSVSWFNPSSGRVEQSFENATEVLNVKYLIVDDAFVARGFLDRGKSWTDSMMNFIGSHWKMIKQINTNYYVGNRVPDPELYPQQWKYPELRKNYIRRIKVYEREDR